MIRHEHGSAYFLFTQHDHALLSGQLAERIGGGPVARPSPDTIQGIALHDCGWPLHDDRPTLNPNGQPLHVFETPPAIATKVWSASAHRAANEHPYSGLLVSLHVLNLSAMSQATHTSAHDVFELSKFQHAQIELQEQLRPRLGLRVDRPLTNGLAHPGTSREEDALLFDFRLLRAMDALSLALLCSEPLKISMGGLLAGPGGPEIQAVVERPAEFSVQVAPWLFREDSLEFEVPFRRLPKGPFANSEDFQRAYGNAVPETVTARVWRGRS